MLTNEDLLAISDLLDKKLKPVKEENTIYQNKTHAEIQKIQSIFENDIRTQIDKMWEDIREMQSDIKDVHGDIEDIQGHIKTNVDPAIRRIQLTLENDITPRMKTIESCYTDTFDRYVVSIGEIEGMKTDIEIMKRLLKEHQEKLQSM